MEFEIGDYVRIKVHYLANPDNWRGKIVNRKMNFDQFGLPFYVYKIMIKDGRIAHEMDCDLEKIDWLLEEL